MIQRHSFETYQILRGIGGSGRHRRSGPPTITRRPMVGAIRSICGGAELTLEMRIIAVADVFQALAQHRPYRQPLSPARILEMLRAFVRQNRLDGMVVEQVGEDLESSWRAATGAEPGERWSWKPAMAD
jgi:hypothetical protein